MATLTLRNQKGTPLSNSEVDGNFTALNNELASHTASLSAHIGFGGNTHAVATTTVPGFMSTTDKTRLDMLFGDTNTYATDLILGKVKLATPTEATAGTDPNKVVTALGLGNAIEYKLNIFAAANTILLDAKIPVSQKGASNGVATLDAGGKVPVFQIPALDYIPNASLAAANGVATLTVNGKVVQTALTADTATTATYSNGANGKWFSLASNSVMDINNTSSVAEFRNLTGTLDANTALISFNCQGNYGIKMGLRSDGIFGIGGWNRTAWSWYSDASGNMVAAGNVTAYSDPKLKENFTIIQDPLSIIKQLDGGSFTWKSGIKHTAVKAGKRDYGILADQVEKVMPEIVSPSIELDGDTYKTVSYEKLVPVLIEAIKVLTARVEELEK